MGPWGENASTHNVNPARPSPNTRDTRKESESRAHEPSRRKHRKRHTTVGATCGEQPTWMIRTLMRFVARVSCMKASTESVLIRAGACTCSTREKKRKQYRRKIVVPHITLHYIHTGKTRLPVSVHTRHSPCHLTRQQLVPGSKQHAPQSNSTEVDEKMNAKAERLGEAHQPPSHPSVAGNKYIGNYAPYLDHPFDICNILGQTLVILIP